MARDELRVHYLPIVSCATGRVAGFESLVRWEHPEHGLLLPGAFLPEAEATGVIVPMGMWAIERACRQMADWHDGSGSTLKLNLNLSGRQFAEPTMPAQVKRIISETGLAPGFGVVGVHRGDAAARSRRDRPDTAPPPRHRRSPRDRRLRQRDLVAGLAQAVPARRDQDRQHVRGRPRQGSRQRRHLQRDRRPRPLARPVRDRRGRRDARTVRGAARARLRARPGAPLRCGTARRGLRRPRPPRRSASWGPTAPDHRDSPGAQPSSARFSDRDIVGHPGPMGFRGCGPWRPVPCWQWWSLPGRYGSRAGFGFGFGFGPGARSGPKRCSGTTAMAGSSARPSLFRSTTRIPPGPRSVWPSSAGRPGARRARIGSVVVNPGGPGAPADSYLRGAVDSMPGGDPGSVRPRVLRSAWGGWKQPHRLRDHPRSALRPVLLAVDARGTGRTHERG